MKKLINAPEAVVHEMLDGLAALYPGLVRLPGHNVILRADAASVRERQVAVLSGGGSGHEPAHAGYVGEGMLSAAVAGDVFTSPSTDEVVAAIRATAGAPGALLIVKNYTGDRLNFGLAAEMLRAGGTPVEMVIVADDVALSDTTDHAGRRGLAGTVFVHKVAGAAAAEGAPLAQVAEEARAAAAAVRTMGVALTPCTVPAAGRPGFPLGEKEIELGLGIHGEPGVRRGFIAPADEVVDQLLGPILGDLEPKRGERVAVMVNNLGGTPTMELAIVARRALSALRALGLVVERACMGTYLSALEMAGVSISVMRLDRARLARLDAPTSAPAWPHVISHVRPGHTPPLVPAPVNPASAAALGGGEGYLAAPLVRVADALLAAADRLTSMDRAVGDGDLGTSLARGARAIKDGLASLSLDDPAHTLRHVGLLVRGAMGGTSGPLYAVFLLRGSRAPALASGSPEGWLDALDAGIAAISELGGARRGDCTMLDALIPAAAAARRAHELGQPTEKLFEVAAAAAATGAAATREMRSRRGRSSYLGDRVLGHVDPGAEAVAIWMRALVRAT